ncbi:MAG: septal ring lytic transglycosylase RlpA family protein [Alphaproteobacteria bacterium]|mgnify:FL=1|nr:septal ring lytic transglycosylase RlpA family protein [Alphaproteobacteria bacterium]
MIKIFLTIIILCSSNQLHAAYKGHFKIGKPYQIFDQWYYPEANVNYEEIGVASWYGPKFNRKKTANGEIFKKHHISAAHPTLPLPSIVEVLNLENGKTLIVRINDRGPFAKDRIIDLSEKAAKKLEFKEQGTTLVKVNFLKKETNELHQKLFGKIMLKSHPENIAKNHSLSEANKL